MATGEKCGKCGHELWELMSSNGSMGEYCPTCAEAELRVLRTQNRIYREALVQIASRGCWGLHDSCGQADLHQATAEDALDDGDKVAKEKKQND